MPRPLLIGSVLALLVCAAIATKLYVVGSDWGNWIYRYIAPFSLRSLGAAALVTAIAVAALRLSMERIDCDERLVLLGWLLLALVLQGLLRSLTPFGFKQIFISNASNSFYFVTLNYSPSAVLTDFARLHTEWPLHARANMPGKLLTIYALELLSPRPRVLAWLVVAISNLGGVLLYVFARDVSGDRHTALFAFVLYLLVPAKLYFFPLMNTLTPTLIIGCACLHFRWLMTGRALYAVCCGAALYFLILFEPLPIVMGLLFLMFLIDAIRRDAMTWQTAARHTALGAAAFAATYAAVFLTTGFDLLGEFRRLAADAVSFNAESQRRYLVWVVQNLFDFTLGVGVCQAVLFVAALLASIRGEAPPQMRVLCVGLAVVLIVTDVLGVNRGEVVRHWIFLACFFQIPAAFVCARSQPRLAMTVVIALTVLQNALGTSMVGFVVP